MTNINESKETLAGTSKEESLVDFLLQDNAKSKILLETSMRTERTHNSSLSINRNLRMNNSSKRSGVESAYKSIPVENLKFGIFLSKLVSKVVERDRLPTNLSYLQKSVLTYVQALEERYLKQIQTLKDQVHTGERKLKRELEKSLQVKVEKNQLRTQFVEVIEEVRKEVIRRKLKGEIELMAKTP